MNLKTRENGKYHWAELQAEYFEACWVYKEIQTEAHVSVAGIRPNYEGHVRNKVEYFVSSCIYRTILKVFFWKVGDFLYYRTSSLNLLSTAKQTF